MGSVWDAIKTFQIMQKAGSCVGFFLFSRGGGYFADMSPKSQRVLQVFMTFDLFVLPMDSGCHCCCGDTLLLRYF